MADVAVYIIHEVSRAIPLSFLPPSSVRPSFRNTPPPRSSKLSAIIPRPNRVYGRHLGDITNRRRWWWLRVTAILLLLLLTRCNIRLRRGRIHDVRTRRLVVVVVVEVLSTALRRRLTIVRAARQRRIRHVPVRRTGEPGAAVRVIPRR